MIDKDMLMCHGKLLYDLCVRNNCADCHDSGLECCLEHMAVELSVQNDVTPYSFCIPESYAKQRWEICQSIADRDGYYAEIIFVEEERFYFFEREEFHWLKNDHYINRINGTVIEEGILKNGSWKVSTVAIQSRLIREAGRWCIGNSDMLIEKWQKVEKYLFSGADKNQTFIFAFELSGVYGEEEYHTDLQRDNVQYRYNSVWKLETLVEGDGIRLTFSKIN